jgi:hypothetical protein
VSATAHDGFFSALDLMPLSILLAIGGSPNSMKSVQNRFPGRARIRTISLVFPPGMGFRSQDQVLSGFSQSSHSVILNPPTLKALLSSSGSSLPNKEFMLNAQSPTVKFLSMRLAW